MLTNRCQRLALLPRPSRLVRIRALCQSAGMPFHHDWMRIPPTRQQCKASYKRATVRRILEMDDYYYYNYYYYYYYYRNYSQVRSVNVSARGWPLPPHRGPLIL